MSDTPPGHETRTEQLLTNTATMKTRSTYVQRKQGATLETVDEFPAGTREERKYAREMLAEYQLGDRAGRYYLSSRPCKGWNDSSNENK